MVEATTTREELCKEMLLNNVTMFLYIFPWGIINYTLEQFHAPKVYNMINIALFFGCMKSDPRVTWIPNTYKRCAIRGYLFMLLFVILVNYYSLLYKTSETSKVDDSYGAIFVALPVRYIVNRAARRIPKN